MRWYNEIMKDKHTIQYFKTYLDYMHAEGLYPNIREVEGPSTSPIVKIDGKEYLTFCSNNYLGLAQNEEIKSETKKAVDIYGTGSGSTRLLSGSLDIQRRFESELARFFGHDGSITFSSGYLANAGVIRMLVDPFSHISNYQPLGIFLEKIKGLL